MQSHQLTFDPAPAKHLDNIALAVNPFDPEETQEMSSLFAAPFFTSVR